MIRDNNPLLDLNLKKEKSFIFKLRKTIFESLYSLFNSIMENPFENIWYESISIIIGYFQLIIYLFDRTVS